MPNNIALIYGSATLFAVGNSLMWLSVVSTLSSRAGTTHQGAVQGIASSFASLASIIGLRGGGILYAWEHYFSNYFSSHIHCFYPIFPAVQD